MNTLRAVLVLLLAQLTGELLHRRMGVPLPGAVLGMALLAVALLLRRREPDAALVTTSNTLLGWMGLLFVPAGAGVLAHLHLLRASFLPIAVALFGSTFVTFATVALIMQWFRRRSAAAEQPVATR